MNRERTSIGLNRKLRSSLTGAVAALLVVACQAGNAHAAAIEPPKCPGDKACYKEIRIVNNTNGPIYAVVQGSIQKNPALNNCKEGDTWLQRALKDTTQCFPVKNDYYVYVNPTRGILKGETASITLPWWSHLPADRDPNADKYVDWWRGGRIYIFDDQTALNDSYKVNAGRQGHPVTFAAGSPLVTCTPQTVVKNTCSSAELKIFRVLPTVVGSAIQTKSPNQLNEWTFADVGPLQTGGELTSLNLNYNVSNVDQLYLPVAMEPIKANFDVGYMGTLMNVTNFRARLVNFTGANLDQTDATNWPIYNNPIVDQVTKRKKYPNAGIRVPSTLALFNYYMNPSYIDGNLNQPEIIPLPKPFDRTKLPKYVLQIEQNWTNCTTSPFTNCPLKNWYAPIKQTFDASYKLYVANCQPVLPYLAPVNNGLPSPEAYLRFVHGWVPFRVDPIGKPGTCTPDKVPDLPQTNEPPSKLGYAPVNYMKLQYDYEQLGATGAQQFNRYTRLIHGPLAQGFLNASAYAFSIDDHESFQNHPGTGLIFAIGGGNGLPNQNRVPPAVPQFYEWYTAGVSLAAPNSPVGWKSYGVCSDDTDRDFPNTNPGTIGLNPKTTVQPCTITLRDTNNKKYQVKILKFDTTGALPYQIWPEFTPSGPKPNDPNVVACPLNDDWCKVGINETAHRSDPSKVNKAPTFTLSTRVPN
jgi:hypothetical protein